MPGLNPKRAADYSLEIQFRPCAGNRSQPPSTDSKRAVRAVGLIYMSLADLKAGTFKTTSLKAMILRELNALDQRAKVDDDCGRLLEAKKKRWLANAVLEWMRLMDNELNHRRAAMGDK